MSSVPPGPVRPSPIRRLTGPLTRFWRRHRRWSVAAIVVAVLLTGTVIADQVVSARIRQRLTIALRCASGDEDQAAAKIGVQVGGPPVLVQLARQELDPVTVTGLPAGSLGAAGAGGTTEAGEILGQSPLELTLHGVGLGRPTTIESVRVSTVVGWRTMQDKLGEKAASSGAGAGLGGSGMTIGADGDQVVMDLPDAFLGRALRVRLSLTVQGNSLTLTPETIQIGDPTVDPDQLKNKIGTGDCADRA